MRMFLIIVDVLAPRTGSEFEADLDALMDQLAALDERDNRISDIDVDAYLDTGRFSISMLVAADGFGAAGDLAVATVRTAVHAIGGYTPGWTENAVYRLSATRADAPGLAGCVNVSSSLT
jgi:hypothetical protein